MSRLPLISFIFAIVLTNVAVSREVHLFDDDWRFHLGDIPQASERDFADSEWRTVDLPHDWSIEGKTHPDAPSGGDGGYFPTGIGWYRKELVAKHDWRGKRVWLDFEGVATTCEIYLNGQKIGGHHYAYTPIHLDITEQIDFDKPNLLAVRVDNSKQPNSRWYTGSGIYRHVRLTVVDPVHFVHNSLRVATRDLSDSMAEVTVDVALSKERPRQGTTVEVYLVDGDGRRYESDGTSISSSGADLFHTWFKIEQPQLWSLDEPGLYTAVAHVEIEGKGVDEVSLLFGIRTVEVSPEKGFLLNGEPVELVGGCVHHDNGPFGCRGI